MTPNNNYSKLLVGILLAGSMAFTACMDSNYDVSDLDKNVALGSDEGLKLPSKNSTKEIELSDLLDIDGSDVISTDENGNYVFAKGAGEADVTPARPEIDRINFKLTQQSSPSFSYEITLPSAAPARKRAAGDMTEIYSFLYNETHSDDIVDLEHADIDTKMGITMTFSNAVKNVVKRINKLTLQIPQYLGSTFTSNKPFEQDANNPNVITFTNIVPTEPISLTAHINKLLFKEGSNSEYYVDFTPADITLKGGVKLSAEILPEDIITANVLTNPGPYDIDCTTDIGNISIVGATGYFDPSIDLTDGIGEVKINNLPDFLTGDEVKLVVDNPQIGLSITSNINVVGQLENLKLVAKLKDGTKKTITLPTITLKRHEGDINSSTTTNILILDKGKEPQFDSQHPNIYNNNYINPTEGSLADLIYSIPESITFECDASADETQLATIKLGQQYKIQPTYDFWAPLAFNHGSTIVYNDTIDGWNGDLKDLKMVKGSYVEVTADVTNRVPADLTLSAIPLQIGSNGKLTKMDEAMFKVEVSTPDNGKGNIIEAGSVDKPKTTKILIKVISQTEEALSLLDGISYHALAATPADGEYQGKALNKATQKLKIENIAPVLKGKVIVNLDK